MQDLIDNYICPEQGLHAGKGRENCIRMFKEVEWRRLDCGVGTTEYDGHDTV